MKSLGFFRTAFLAALLIFFPGVASLFGAAVEEPGVFVRRAVDDVLAVAFPGNAKQSPAPLLERVHPVLERYLDFTAITRRAMGPGWRQFSADEQQRAVTAFTALIERTYAARFDAKDRPRLTYEPAVELASDRWEVPTSVGYADATYRVNYRLERSPAGWRVYDIVIEGVSFVANYRAQFGAMLEKGGPAAVMRALEAKVTKPTKN